MKTELFKGRAKLAEFKENYKSKIEEAKILLEKGFYLSSIYLGGYAIEILLKVIIMEKLGLSELPDCFKTHDLELLLFISGVKDKLDANKKQKENFSFVNAQVQWSEQIRYKDPKFYSQEKAELFLDILTGEDGLIAWLQAQK